MITIVPLIINIAIVVGVIAFSVVKLKAMLNSVSNKNDVERLSCEVERLRSELEELREEAKNR